MSMALHDISATMFLRGLNAGSGLIDTALQSDLDEVEIMEARLASVT